MTFNQQVAGSSPVTQTKILKGGLIRMHKLNIKNLESGGTSVMLDGQSVRCTGYCLSHYVDVYPTIELDLLIEPPEVEEDNVYVSIGNKKEIAELMNKVEFEEFCDIWKEIHRNNNAE